MYRSLSVRAALAGALAASMVACSSGAVDPNAGVERIDPTLSAVAEAYSGGALFSLWDGDGQVWAAGGKAGESVVLQYDGASWTTHDPGLGQQLWWVHGFEGGPVFVVGAGGVCARYQAGTWTPIDTGAPTTLLYGVWGAAPDDLWAVGGVWRAAPAGTSSEGDVVIHYDGSAWTRVDVPALAGKPESAQKDLFKVWGASADVAFIVGSGGVALHWDGSSWERKDTGMNEPLFTVVGRSATDVWAVGGLGDTKVMHWDGGLWSSVEVPEFAPPQTPGIWTAPGHAVYIAGIGGYTARLDPDGTWTEGNPITNDGYHAVRGVGHAIWAAGGDISSLSPTRGALGVTDTSVPALQ